MYYAWRPPAAGAALLRPADRMPPHGPGTADRLRFVYVIPPENSECLEELVFMIGGMYFIMPGWQTAN